MDIFTELQHQYPSVSEVSTFSFSWFELISKCVKNEYNTLLKLDHPAFRKLIPNQVNQ